MVVAASSGETTNAGTPRVSRITSSSMSHGLAASPRPPVTYSIGMRAFTASVSAVSAFVKPAP